MLTNFIYIYVNTNFLRSSFDTVIVIIIMAATTRGPTARITVQVIYMNSSEPQNLPMR